MQQLKNIGYKQKQNDCGNIVSNIVGVVNNEGKTIADHLNCFFQYYCINAC